MKKIYSLLAFLLAAGWAMAQNSTVTFQVDMTGHTVSTAGVYIAGNFQSQAGNPSNWDPSGTKMTNVSGNIYEVQVTIPDGIYEYKFINDSTWNGAETVPALNQVGYNGNSNRWVLVQGDTTFPAIEFGGTSPANMKAVSMIVNLENETSIEDTISVAGNLQGWSPGSTLMAQLDSSTDKYHYIHYDSTNANLEWKFVNGTGWGQDESVPGTCANNGNRFYNGTTDTIYDVCFGQCKACFIPDTFNLTLKVDMNATCGFDPATDSVDIAGPFNGWPGSPALGHIMDDSDGDGIYEISLDAVGPTFEYKARYIKSGNVNWEGGGNNIIQISSDTVMDPRCFGFDQLGACAPKPDPSDITFEVDMRNYSGSVTLSDMYVMGDFTDPNWQGGALKMNPSATPGVFELTVNDICPGKISYKYVVNDPSSGVNGTDFLEEDFSGATDTSCLEPSGVGNFNRFYIRPDDQPQTIASEWQLCSTSGLEENELANKVTVYPNPFSGSATIEINAAGKFNLELMDVTGKTVKTATDIENDYVLNASELPAGVYLLNLSSESGAAVSKKVIIQ